MNRSLVAGSRHWEKLERPGNEAGIFRLRRSFTEQVCSVKVAFKRTETKMSFKKRQKNWPISCHVAPRAYLITHSSWKCPPTKESKKIAEKKSRNKLYKTFFLGRYLSVIGET